MKRRNIAVASALAGLATVALGAPALAQEQTVGCEENNHRLTTTYVFTQDATTHFWDKAKYKLSGSGTGGQSNVRIWLRLSGTTTGFDWHSPDNRVNGVLYTKQLDMSSARAKDEKWRSTAVFDTSGTDNRCTALYDS